MATDLTPLRRAETTAKRQEGALAHAQAIAAGMSDAQIFRAIRSGRWHRPVTGVYCVAGAPDTSRQRAMVAYLATRRAGGVVSHLTAAAEWGFLPPSPLPHVTVPPTASARNTGATIHRSVVPVIDRAHRNELVLTSVSRTIADLATLVHRDTLESVVDTAFCRRLATAESVEKALGRLGRGRPGKALARSVVQVWTSVIDPGSPAEMRLLRRAAEEGIVGLVAQHEVFDESGGFVARLDLAQPRWRRAFEYDGLQTHNPRRWGRDERRYSALRALGWEIESITKLDLLPGERRLRDIAIHWGAAAA